MASDSWGSRFSTSSRRHHLSRSDLYDEADMEEDLRSEFLCPFCAEDFDVVGLCCHIDEEHPVEVKNGVCPVCAKRVGMDIIGHITMQHGNFVKVQRKRRLRRGSNPPFSLLRRELREESLQSLLGGSSYYFVSSSNTEPDPLLSSFIFNPPAPEESFDTQSISTVDASSTKSSKNEEYQERTLCNHQIYLTRIKDKTRKGQSLSRNCCYPQFWKTCYELDGELMMREIH